MSLQQLRQAHKLTQVRVAKSLGIGQGSVARLERRSDILLSTLQHYVESMGGSLSLVAQVLDRELVILAGIGDSQDPPSKARESTMPSASVGSPILFVPARDRQLRRQDGRERTWQFLRNSV